MDINQIERIVRRGAVYLSEALFTYWPTKGEDNEIAERNITLHLGRSFAQNGFCVYGEVGSDNDRNERYDLLCLEPRERVSVICEFKRLYSGEKLDGMANDLGRIGRFEELDKKISSSYQKYGLIAGTTWQDSYLHYWTCDKVELPEDGYPAAWNSFDAATKDLWDTGKWGCHVLQDNTNLEEPGPDSDWHYLLYLLWKIPAGHSGSNVAAD